MKSTSLGINNARCVVLKVAAGLVAALLISPMASHAGLVTVPGTSDPWLAGMPDGSTASGGDTAPAHSPALVSGLALGSGGFLTFTNAIGGVSNAGGCSLVTPFAGCAPIDGTGFFNHAAGAQNGISDVRSPVNALLGVFLGNSQPSLTAAPGTLNFQTLGLDFLTLAPQLKQVFFIGNGATASNVVQEFDIPTGASRLFLGTMDGFGWFNNSGAINVEVNQFTRQATVPEPGTVVLLAGGLVVLGGIGFRTRRSRPRLKESI